MLAKLPPEVLEMIAESLTSKDDLKSLSLASRAVHRGVQRTLWKSLDLSPIKENQPWNFKPKRVFDKNLPAFKLATELNFNSPFMDKYGERCPHYRDQESTFDGDEDPRSRFYCLSRTAESIVKNLPAHRLRKFSWNLGTCVPDSLLGRQGILARQQTQIRSLSLTTAGDCMIWDEIDLSAFCQLRSFCWRGPRHDNLDAIAVAIRNNRESLTHLELDFVDWPRLRDQISDLDDDDDDSTVGDFFSTRILSMDEVTPERPVFPALVSLSLSSVPLGSREIHAFDLNKLQSLSLRKCPGWHTFVAGIAHLKPPLQLRTFEVHHMDGRLGERLWAAERDALVEFIDSFEGLQELFLNLARPLDTLELWKGVVRQHGATLRKFVHHQRYQMGGGRVRFGILEDVDIPDFDLAPKLSQVHGKNPLRGIHSLESIGISCLPELLVPMFASFTRHTTPSSLRLIHIRQTRRGRDRQGSWVTVGPSPRILQVSDISGNRDRVPLDVTRYRDLTIGPRGQKLDEAEVGSEEEVRRMGLGENIKHLGFETTSPKCGPLPLSKSSVLREPVRRFAKWVFGPKGLPALKVIALGDFSHGRVSKERDNMFLVRGNGGPSVAGCTDNYTIFWPEEKRSQDWAELVDRNLHVLEACPAEPLVDYDMI